LLLEAIQSFGLGNWEAVGKQLQKSPKDCEFHYWRLYFMDEDRGLSEMPVYLLDAFERRDHILKNQANIKEEAVSDEKSAATGSIDVDDLLALDKDEEPSPIGDAVKNESTLAPQSATSQLLLLNDPKEVTRSDIQKDDRGLPLAMLKERDLEPFYLPFERPKKKEKENDIGWNPLRRSFAIQHDNAAEEYVGGYDLDPNDIPEKAQLKIKMLETFEHVLQERERREQFVIERGLQDMNVVNESGYRDSKTKRIQNPDKYALDVYRPYARFIKGPEFEQFMETLKKQRELWKKLKKFKKYRDNGITSLAEVEQFEMESRKRRAQQARKSGRAGRSATVISDEPGFELMTHNEQKLCTKLGFSPSQLLVIKDSMVRESFKLGTISRKTAIALFTNVDPDKVERIFDYMVESHFIEEER